MSVTLHLNDDRDDVTVQILAGRRKIEWVFPLTTKFEDAEFAADLADILSALSVPLAQPVANPDRTLVQYAAEIAAEVAAGAPVVDPRVVPQKEADVASTPAYQAAINGAAMMKDPNHPGWEQMSLVDADDKSARQQASARAASGGVNSEGSQTPGVKYSERFGSKESDHYR